MATKKIAPKAAQGKASKTAAKPVAKPASKPVAKKAQPVAEPASKVAAKKAGPVAKPVSKAAVKKAQPAAKPAPKASKQVDKPIAQPAAKPVKPVSSATASAGKKLCRIISYDKMTPEIKVLFEARYPEGYADAVMRYPKPSGECFYAVGLYTKEADYLIKVDVNVDMSALEEDYGSVEANMEEVEGDTSSENQGNPDVNDLADTLADETSEPV